MSTFNIASQNAGSIQNVGGDMVVQDGIHATATVHVTELRDRTESRTDARRRFRVIAVATDLGL